MQHLLKQQITHLITFRKGAYEVINAAKHEIEGDDKTEQSVSINYQRYLLNVLDGIEFFHSLGCKESLTFKVAPHTMDTIHLQVRSISPDLTHEMRFIFTLKFASPEKLTEFINIK